MMLSKMMLSKMIQPMYEIQPQFKRKIILLHNFLLREVNPLQKHC